MVDRVRIGPHGSGVGSVRGVTGAARSLFRFVPDGSRLASVRLTLRALIALMVGYAVAATLSSQVYPDGGARRLLFGTAVFGVIGFGFSYAFAARPAMRAARTQRERIRAQQAALTAQADQHEFVARVQTGLDMAETEAEAQVLVARVLPRVSSGPAELLLADSSRAHLARVAVSPIGTPGCSVRTPERCPAVRRGHTTSFVSSEEVDACPRLAERGPGLSAVCTPVMILGSPMGVLHTTGRAGVLPADDELSRTEALAVHTGARIGTLRATASTELAATTDPLTGLLNRRSMTDRLEQLTAADTGFAVAFADLDSFKALNDTYGHTVGDQALRLFAQTLRSVLRDTEVICRYGGEEFVVVLPGCTAEQAAPVVHRIRDELRAATTRADCATPAFTASFGLADSTDAVAAADVIDLADRALLQAKKEGKDRLILTDRPAAGARDDAARTAARGPTHLSEERLSAVPDRADAVPSAGVDRR